MARVLPPEPDQAPPPNPLTAAKGVTRGVRNHNPGNIDRTSPRTPWRGVLPDDEYPHTYEARNNGGRFEVFIGPQWGIRALAVVLQTYQRKHGLRTVAAMINRWAPPVENKTTAYVVQVALRMGVDANQPVDLNDVTLMRPMVDAIIHHENEGYVYPDDVVREGLRLAGIEAAQPVGRTPAVRSAGMAAAPVVAIGSASAALSLLEQVGPHMETVNAMTRLIGENGLNVAILAGLLALAGLTWAYLKRAAKRQETGL